MCTKSAGLDLVCLIKTYDDNGGDDDDDDDDDDDVDELFLCNG